MWPLPFFQWAEATTIGEMIRTSAWAFAVIESFHLLALSVIGGAVLIVDCGCSDSGCARSRSPTSRGTRGRGWSAA